MAFERPLLDNPPPSSDLPSPLSEPPIRADPTSPSHRQSPSFSLEPPDPFLRPPSAASLREQRELSDSDARTIYLNDPGRTNDRSGLAGNSVRTAKYSILTFLPRNLFEQFHRLAYVYFLAIAVLNQLPQLAVFGRGASLLPLAFVLFVTAIKDAYEDFRRHRSDRLENNRTVNTLNGSGEFVPKRWKDLKVGEIIRVSSDETLPADIVLLATSGSTGVAYVQTINLDGETNLKTRYAKQETLSQNPQNGTNTINNIIIRCERPNRNIYGFHANLEISNKRVSLGPSNIVLRGCELKNTNWAIGVVVYAGPETKVMLNSSGAPSKRSRLESHMNKETLSLSVLLIIICSVVAILNGIWLVIHRNQLTNMQYFRLKDYSTGTEKNYNYYGIAMQVFITFLMAVIVFQIMIPISLYISMELVRLGQAYFMVRDSDLYDEGSNSRFQCRALNINEDLGQIKYVFSDKTGTLTENKMEFNCATIRGVDYSNGVMDGSNIYSVVAGDQLWKPKVPTKTDPELLQLLKHESTTEKGKWAFEFFLALATCNTIVPIVLDTADPAQKLIEYQGESPDEQALVYAAASYGFVLVERSSGHIVIHVLGQTQRYELLGVHEFDSDRKRMSVILTCPDKSVKLFTKGADNSMLNILNPSLDPLLTRHTELHLHRYSSLGLRTLVIASRLLTHSDLATWRSEFLHTSTSLFNRGNLLKNLANKIENNLILLGASGIEDRLQKGVSEAIEGLREAGIRVWVLTGDKQETAVSIGVSCGLLTGRMARVVINENSRGGCRKGLEDAVGKVMMSADGGDSVALVIDGNSLVYILDSDLEELLFKVATGCDVVLCCRVAPLQKAGIVALIKNRTDDMTLAIGDGANDVSMIQMADVGIGMSGQEGRQAVMASDFSVAQFRFILPLLLVHGHWNYQRMGYMILYNFYKNATFVFVLFWYVLYTAYTLTTAVTEWSSMLYSVLYTALPTILVAIFDKNLNKNTLLTYPKLYSSGQNEQKYNTKLFVFSILNSLYQSLVIFYVPYFVFKVSTIDVASLGDIWTVGAVIVVNCQLAVDVARWSWVIHAFIWGTVIVSWVCVVVLDSVWVLPGYWAIYHVMGSGVFWALLIFITVVALLPHFVCKVFGEYFLPDDIQIAREMEKFKGNLVRNSRSEVQMRMFEQ
ncbi:hypothetical protein LUZ60_004024 [Juncus effusus]|nr:hypothetical protein LUZ60_004024 [Juncus effusus]